MATQILEKIETAEEAIQLANEAERLEAVLKSIKDKLKSYVDNHGPIMTADKVWDYTVSTSWRFESSSLKEMAQDMVLDGINPWEILTVTSANLKKIGWGEEILSKYGQKKETRRFDSRKR
ncbi:hypothetical protein L1765_11250 [Microaerobacter geothermalis]|uniref:hypothetical protein n=1 Tax=Microaerobacter geothermalis TaxID=674972 RepID=UPI001F2026A5|nr:hypothetical protein [Microaerobacter geothermalis]MCF6094539.1 hypothetical protein [Microaerobacter geothermalis]